MGLRNFSDTPGDDDTIAEDVGVCDEMISKGEVTLAEDMGIWDEVANRSNEEISVDVELGNSVVVEDDLRTRLNVVSEDDVGT